MIRRAVLLVLSALLVLAVVPAGPASAKATSFAPYTGCYGIKKKGNYNRVRVHVSGLGSGSKVAAYASLSVSASCQRVNSLPVIEMHIYAVELTNSSGKDIARAGGVGTTRKGLISKTTPYVGVACGHPVVAHVKVGYTYYDDSVVRPFWVHNRAFFRC